MGNEGDSYIDPKTGILRNKPDLTTQAELDRAERVYAALRAIGFLLQFAAGANISFDLKHLKAIHQGLFGGVYAWARDTRTVDIGRRAAADGTGRHLRGHRRKSTIALRATDLRKSVGCPTAISKPMLRPGTRGCRSPVAPCHDGEGVGRFAVGGGEIERLAVVDRSADPRQRVQIPLS